MAIQYDSELAILSGDVEMQTHKQRVLLPLCAMDYEMICGSRIAPDPLFYLIRGEPPVGIQKRTPSKRSVVVTQRGETQCGVWSTPDLVLGSR